MHTKIFFSESDPVVYPLGPHDSWSKAYNNFHTKWPNGFCRNSSAQRGDVYYHPFLEGIEGEQGGYSDARWHGSHLQFYSSIDTAFYEEGVDMSVASYIQHMISQTFDNARELILSDIDQDRMQIISDQTETTMQRLRSLCNRYVAPAVRRLVEDYGYNVYDLHA